MPSVGPLYPGTTSDDSTVGTVAWQNTGNVAADDGTGATTVLQISLEETHYLKALNFSPGIPATATIDNILVEVDRKKTGAGAPIVKDSHVKLVKNGTIQSTDMADTSTAWTTSYVTVSYNFPSPGWTGADANDATSGLVISCVESNAGSGQPDIDFIRITITYTEATVAPSRVWTNNDEAGVRRVVVDSLGRVVTCDDCPCPPFGTASGTSEMIDCGDCGARHCANAYDHDIGTGPLGIGQNVRTFSWSGGGTSTATLTIQWNSQVNGVQNNTPAGALLYMSISFQERLINEPFISVTPPAGWVALTPYLSDVVVIPDTVWYTFDFYYLNAPSRNSETFTATLPGSATWIATDTTFDVGGVSVPRTASAPDVGAVASGTPCGPTPALSYDCEFVMVAGEDSSRPSGAGNVLNSADAGHDGLCVCLRLNTGASTINGNGPYITGKFLRSGVASAPDVITYSPTYANPPGVQCEACLITTFPYT